MPYLSLYRKYRSQSFDEVSGQCVTVGDESSQQCERKSRHRVVRHARFSLSCGTSCHRVTSAC